MKAFTQSVIFRALYLDPSQRRPPAGRCHRATVTTMVVLSLIAWGAANCPTYTVPAATAVPNASIDGKLGRAEPDIDHAVQRGRTFDIESRRWAVALKAKDAKTGSAGSQILARGLPRGGPVAREGGRHPDCSKAMDR